ASVSFSGAELEVNEPLSFQFASFSDRLQLKRSDMSDPFDFLNPIASTKTPAEKMLGQPHHSPAGVPPAPVAPANFGMGMGMSGNHGNMGMPGAQGSMGMGMGMPGAHGNMGMGSPSGYNGGGMHMNMNMGGMSPNGGGMPGAFPPAGMGYGMNQQQQQPPVMYDNIKKLLEKKPVVDSASMDFLEGLGGGATTASSFAPPEPVARAPEPTMPVTHDQFPGTAPSGPGALDFNFLGGGSPSSQPASPASGSGTPKSSALSSRLAHGKRPTQEAARKTLGFNAGAFTSTGNSPKISLKGLGGSSASGDSEPSVDDFVAGNASLLPGGDDFPSASSKPTAASTASDAFW
ncbi:hypothetical protein BBJ28_00018712, partial [Nothophytophthora sp. Chile5]